jgi:hypothetical protein
VPAFPMMFVAAFRRTRGEGFGVGEDRVEGLEGEIEEIPGLFVNEERTVILGVGEGFTEGKGVASPVGDGVAVNAGLGRGVRHAHAF